MIKALLALPLAALLAVPSLAGKTEDTPGRFKLIHAADLAARLRSPNPPQVYDANVASVRENVGLIPGAHPLSSSSKYDADKTLPADKTAPLVFYCANPMCMASHQAAEKAVESGHTDVSVMSDGIFGWRDAKLPLAPMAGKPRKLDPRAVAALRDEHGAVIVDVREPEERFELVPGARSLPMSQAKDAAAWKGFVASLPKDQTVVFHCAAGGRAKKASEKLAAEGFSTAYFESPDQWKKSGLPVEKGPAR